VELVEDRSIGLGGCIVQSEMGEIDARIEQQFAEIEQEFLSV
jgi:flagellar assembly protein FliH